jgi:hypothetical protein
MLPCRQFARSERAPQQRPKTLAALLSGDCCLAGPKLKWFALERSPNIPHAQLSHGLPESLQHICATGLDQLRATSTTAVRFASDKLAQLLITEMS